MAQRLDYLKESPSQTAGPYVHIGLAPSDARIDVYRRELGRDIVGPDAEGERITVTGQLFDGLGEPVKDALIEIWQADAQGEYPGKEDNGFCGWGRVVPDFDTGLFSFQTIKPGAVKAHNGQLAAPHLSFWLVARGINIGLQTRMYFGDEEKANVSDPVLNLIPEARRNTLIAKSDGTSYRFDIRLQGDDETVFFDI